MNDGDEAADWTRSSRHACEIFLKRSWKIGAVSSPVWFLLSRAGARDERRPLRDPV